MAGSRISIKKLDEALVWVLKGTFDFAEGVDPKLTSVKALLFSGVKINRKALGIARDSGSDELYNLVQTAHKSQQKGNVA